MTLAVIGGFQVAFSRTLSIQLGSVIIQARKLSGWEGWFTPAPTFAGLDVRVFTQALKGRARFNRRSATKIKQSYNLGCWSGSLYRHRREGAGTSESLRFRINSRGAYEKALSHISCAVNGVICFRFGFVWSGKGEDWPGCVPNSRRGAGKRLFAQSGSRSSL